MLFQKLLVLMGNMFLMIMAGFFVRKKGLVSDEGKKCYTDILLYTIFPCNVLKAFTQKGLTNAGETIGIMLGIAILIQLFLMLLAKICYNRMKPGVKAVYQYGTVCSNSGFIGIPLAQGVFEDIGLVFASVFLIPQRIVMWTAGVSYFQKGENKKDLYKKVLVNPCMLATYIGMILMVMQWEIPGVLGESIASISACNTPLTMMYIGMVLADADIRTLYDKEQLYFAVMRLILIPAIVYVACKIGKINPLVTGVSTLLCATPAGSTSALLAAKYHAYEESATKSVVFTTMLSIVTIPIWSYLLLLGIQ